MAESDPQHPVANPYPPIKKAALYLSIFDLNRKLGLIPADIATAANEIGAAWFTSR